MNAYVDTSVVLRIVLAEPKPLAEWREIGLAVTSDLARVEALRTIDRARVRLGLSDEDVSAKRVAVMETLAGFHIAPLDATVLDRAAAPFPTLLGTLDALHLATASRLRSNFEDLVFATHDRQLAIAAQAVGFATIGARP